MSSADLVQAFEARLSLYGLDDGSRRILADSWPVIAPHLEKAVDEIVIAVRVLPRIGAAVAQNEVFFKKLELAHFRALLGGKLDRDYAESCRHTVHQEAALGMDARIRSTGGNDCVEVAQTAASCLIRDSKDPDGARLAVRPNAWAAFICGIKHGARGRT